MLWASQPEPTDHQSSKQHPQRRLGGRGAVALVNAEEEADCGAESSPRIRRQQHPQLDLLGATLSHRMYFFIGFRKSTPPQNRQHIILISDDKEQVYDFVRELTL